MKEYIFEFPGVNHSHGVQLRPAISKIVARNHTFKDSHLIKIQIEVVTTSGQKQVQTGSLMTLDGIAIHLESRGLSKSLFVQVWPSSSVGRLVIEAY